MIDSPFSHLRLCLDPSFPFRRASLRSRLSRRAILRVVVVIGRESSGTDSLTLVPRTSLGEASGDTGFAAVASDSTTSIAADVVAAGCIIGTMCVAIMWMSR